MQGRRLIATLWRRERKRWKRPPPDCRRWLSATKNEESLGPSSPPLKRGPDGGENRQEEKSLISDVDELMKQQQRRIPQLSVQELFPSSVSNNYNNNRSTCGDHSQSVESDLEIDGEKSLFDVFKVPDPPPSRNPHAFDAEACRQYLEVLEPIITEDPKFRRRHTSNPISDEVADPVVTWLRTEEPVLDPELPLFQDALSNGISVSKAEHSAQFLKETKRQQEQFIKLMGYDNIQFRMAKGALFQITNMCARDAKGVPLEVLWEKVKEMGLADKKLLQNLLYVSATFFTGSPGKRSRHGRFLGVSILDVLEPDESSLCTDDISAEDLVDIADEIAIYHDLLNEPTEQSISIRIRLLVSQGKAREAEMLLRENSHVPLMRLRSYTPVFNLYLEQGDIGSALNLYKCMRNIPSVHLGPETYVQLIAGVAESGHFHPTSIPIKGAEELGYSPACGPALFDQLASEMSEEIIEIPLVLTKQLYNAFAAGFPEAGLEKTDSFMPLHVVEGKAAEHELIINRVLIDPSKGYCS